MEKGKARNRKLMTWTETGMREGEGDEVSRYAVVWGGQELHEKLTYPSRHKDERCRHGGHSCGSERT